ncbi:MULTISPECIES: acetylornithine deacetylase [unclassified Colwellia]|jgi:acetylornithine deacetylase|uniref:acetylornithine deacetylase n=1 Tax=unclassified Colwellia TaxID=196834 RepID=UPI0015F666E2|nr:MULTISPECIES: acetylornithine deacetylase [unclassified Colwellia]MBA6338784.1 acetylornithine deacetylase [Colwellia sp. BRX8-7]MBA6372852.1 acetylornithine deacetylase [Colwellia sp. BRX8-4]MBA6380780.1 acetylornithine deacetylase [Colwellia sp. BRX10-7]MBA6384992.1 acetylornithine deacetylase [Colwellia sp. BRX10-9]MBA6388311.1 acetylornithine deacetylase [Colwellia sp. BRX10-2]
MKNLPNFTDSLTQLIASASISSTQANWDQGNLAVIQLLASWFEQLGFSIDIQAVPETRNKYNLLAKLGSGTGGLLLAGHSDTVPFDENRWQSDPFKIVDKDNKFYGLGTCDMKGFFAFILQVCKGLTAQQLKKPLYILATADEETTMAGARFFTKNQQIKPDVAIIGEPTNLVPVIMHKGHMSHRITIQGQSGHSSKPSLGVNAIEIIHQVIGQLMQLKEKLALNYSNQAFDVKEPTLNFGAIHGGDNANRICGHCELDIDMRALPGMTDSELILLLSEALKPLAEKYPNRISFSELDPSSPSFEQSKNSDFVTIAEEISGHSCCAVNYATEAPFIQQLGCQTIVLGPGSIDQAHQPNEFLAHSEIDKTEQLLLKMIERYCL